MKVLLEKRLNKSRPPTSAWRKEQLYAMCMPAAFCGEVARQFSRQDRLADAVCSEQLPRAPVNMERTGGAKRWREDYREWKKLQRPLPGRRRQNACT